MALEDNDPDWKAKLASGELKTSLIHYTYLADGNTHRLDKSFDCPPGNAVMGLKVWAASADDGYSMLASVAKQVGFAITGKVEAYRTEPSMPPQSGASAYDINFTPHRTVN